MRAIPQATQVTLTAEERQTLEALAGSRKSEARNRERARIVLGAAAGQASRATRATWAAHPARPRSGASVSPGTGWRGLGPEGK